MRGRSEGVRDAPERRRRRKGLRGGGREKENYGTEIDVSLSNLTVVASLLAAAAPAPALGCEGGQHEPIAMRRAEGREERAGASLAERTQGR